VKQPDRACPSGARGSQSCPVERGERVAVALGTAIANLATGIIDGIPMAALY